MLVASPWRFLLLIVVPEREGGALRRACCRFSARCLAAVPLRGRRVALPPSSGTYLARPKRAATRAPGLVALLVALSSERGAPKSIKLNAQCQSSVKRDQCATQTTRALVAAQNHTLPQPYKLAKKAVLSVSPSARALRSLKVTPRSIKSCQYPSPRSQQKTPSCKPSAAATRKARGSPSALCPGPLRERLIDSGSHEADAGRRDGRRGPVVIRAHPDLAGRAALQGDVTAESASEQAKAGLS